jgi:phosphinothricin acetyltransferase
VTDTGTAPGAFHIRLATEADLPAVHAIYQHHVFHSSGTFEEQAPDLAEMRRRYNVVVTNRLPYLVAHAADGTIIGYAYAGPFRPRSAYRYTVEDSIYVKTGHARQGIGRALLAALVAHCEALGYRQMIAVIGDSQNLASISTHKKLGFQHIGTFAASGFKFGRWLDSVFMQRPLGEGNNTIPSDTPHAQIPD